MENVTPIKVKTEDAVNQAIAEKKEEEKAQLARDFETLLKTGAITQDADGFYVVSRRTDKAEVAVNYVQRFSNMDSFDRMMGLCFKEGMAEAVRAYRRELAKLGPMYGKALEIGDKLLAVITKQNYKVNEKKVN